MLSRSALSLSISLLALISASYAPSAYAQAPVCARGEVLTSGPSSDVACAPGFMAESDGRVGINIGTSSPQEALDVKGSITFGPGTTVVPYTHDAALIARGPKSNFNLDLQDGTGRVNYLWNATDGYDIWTHQNAGNYLVAQEPASNFKQTINPEGNAGAYFGFYSSSGGAAGAPIAWSEIAQFSGANNIWLSPIGDKSNFFIANTGAVGIGTTAPQTKLDVNGTVNAAAYTLNGKPFSMPPVCVGGNMLQFDGVKFLCTAVIR